MLYLKLTENNGVQGHLVETPTTELRMRYVWRKTAPPKFIAMDTVIIIKLVIIIIILY